MSRTDNYEHINPMLMEKLERRYLRLCRVQEELRKLDFKNAAPGASPEDFVFSRIDFERYRKIPERDFDEFFLKGLEDFSEVFYTKNFRRSRKEIESLIIDSYNRVDRICMLRKETPMILSVMRTLETSLDEAQLIQGEDFLHLDGVIITHRDGMETKLFLSDEGALMGTFQPGGKPWTKILAR